MSVRVAEQNRPMASCGWCRRVEATQTVCFGRGHAGESAELPCSLCAMCARLLAPSAYANELHDDLDVLAVAQSAVDDRLAELFASGASSADRCWWCGRPGAPVDCSQHDDGRLRFEQPVLCDVCVGLSGHVGGGFAYVDEQWYASVERALEMLARAADPPPASLRERSVELVIAKLALLELNASDNFFAYPGDGFSEFAGDLGLSEAEARSLIMRLFDEPDSLISFRRFDGSVVPCLSTAGRQHLRELQRAHRMGPPYANEALRSASLRRTLARLDAEPVPR